MRLFPGKTYTRFLVREYLKVLFVCILFIMSLSYIVKALERSDTKKTFTVFQTLTIYLLEAPNALLREALLPSCMFASVYTVSTLTKNREILALRSCAVSVYRIITPLILLGCAISVSSLFSEDYVLIRAFTARDNFVARLRGEGRTSYFQDRTNVIAFGENNTVFKIDRYLHKSEEMQGVMILQKNSEGKVVSLSSAEGAKWDGKRWVLVKGVRYTFDRSGALIERKVFEHLTTGMKENPRYFGRDIRKVENMRLKEGREYIAMSKKMGLSYKKMLARYHRRIAQSVTLLFVIVIGLSLGSMAFRNALVISFSITLGFVLVFLFINEIGYTFGSSGAIPPVLGGWLGNVVFFFLSVYLLRRLRV